MQKSQFIDEENYAAKRRFRRGFVATSNQAATLINEIKKMIMIDPRRVTVAMQDTFRLGTEEPDIASMRRLDQTMDDILNSHD